jgi:hypothetical protein
LSEDKRTVLKQAFIAAGILISGLFDQQPILAQEKTSSREPSDNASQVYIELGGPGFIYSINYDGRIGFNEDGFGFRLGVGGAYWNGSGHMDIPIQINYLTGADGKYLELGAGFTYAPGLNLFGNEHNLTYPDLHYADFFGTCTLGFRLQPEHKEGLTFRAAFTPIFSMSNNPGYFPFVGVSFGIRF